MSKKSNDCMRHEMGRFKRGTLKSGRKRLPVTDRQQAIAIGLSKCEKGKSYAELAEQVLQTAKNFSEDCECEAKKGTKEYDECIKCKKRVKNTTPAFSESEDETLNMVRSRLRVINGRVSELIRMLETAMISNEQADLEPWMVDKITLAADYISAVADSAIYGTPSEVATRFDEDGLKDACWDGYTAIGLKKKGNRMVPNCVKDLKGELK